MPPVTRNGGKRREVTVPSVAYNLDQKAARKAKREEKQARYDDIFSAVSRAVQDEGTFGGISRRLIEENSMPMRMRLFSQSSHASTDEEEEEREGRRAAAASTTTSAASRPAELRAALVARNTVEEEGERRSQNRTLRDERERSKSAGKGGQRFQCKQCPVQLERHLQLHKHIMENHHGTGCGSCKQPWRVLRQRHECFKCPQFAANLDKHLIEKHYAVSSRRGALLECSRCARTFEHLKEVMHHEKTVHGLLHKGGAAAAAAAARRAVATMMKRQVFHCRACGEPFDSRYLRDQHLTKHFQSVIDSVWLTIERMQDEQPDQYMVNQCPLCNFVMSSRKSFRTHVIHRHLMYDGNALERLIGPGVKQEELLTVREHIALEGRMSTSDPVVLPSIDSVKEEEPHEEEDQRSQGESSSL